MPLSVVVPLEPVVPVVAVVGRGTVFRLLAFGLLLGEGGGGGGRPVAVWLRYDSLKLPVPRCLI